MSRVAAVRDRYERVAVRAATTVDGAGERLDGWRRRRWTTWEESPFLRTTTPRILVGVLLIWYFVVFENLVWLRQAHYGTFDYDLGMYDQGIWQLAHGRGFMTVRGMHVFGHHANIGYLLLVPFYWVGIGGPQFLDTINTFAVVMVALPLFLLAVRHLKSAWAGLFLVVAYFLHFAPQWMIQETFHPECIAAPFLVGAFYFASVSKWRWYWVCIAVALLWKEDVALAVAMLGPDGVAQIWQATPAADPGPAPVRNLVDRSPGFSVAQTETGAVLSIREREVLALLCQRLTDPEIAARLFLSPRTINRHVANILAKLNASNRREAAALAARLGLV